MADILILSTADWDHPLWTNKQHVAVSLHALGHRIIYVESLGIRTPRLYCGRDVFRILRRLRRLLNPLQQRLPGIWVLSPPVLPGLTEGIGLKFNSFVLAICLSVVRWRLGVRELLLWTFNPLASRYLDLKSFSQTVYHCVDRLQAQPGMPIALLDCAESELCRQVNIVFTTAPFLQKKLAPLNADTYFFGNVADVDHFKSASLGTCSRPTDLPWVRGPMLIFIGAIDAYKLELDQIYELVKRTPEWTYVFIGPIGESDPSTNVELLRTLPNLYLMGSRAYRDLPAYLAYADVALLPLRINDYTCHMYPMKFFEYLASGCPIVGTAIPSLYEQADVASLCKPTAVEFEKAIRRVLHGDVPSLESRLARANLNTYKRRTAAMLRLLPRPLS